MTQIAAPRGALGARHLRWREVEPEEGRPADSTRYDKTADLQNEAGLNCPGFTTSPARRDADGVPTSETATFCASAARFGARSLRGSRGRGQRQILRRMAGVGICACRRPPSWASRRAV
jgi:hypothetical protein